MSDLELLCAVSLAIESAAERKLRSRRFLLVDNAMEALASFDSLECAFEALTDGEERSGACILDMSHDDSDAACDCAACA